MKRALWASCVLLMAGACYWLAAQRPAARQLAAWMPAGAILHVEANDFASLWNDWSQSPEKAAWLASANYQAWLRSRVALRLEEVRADYAGLSGVTLDAALISGLAGREAALAIYDLSQGEFLYLAQLPAERVSQTALWAVRNQFQTRTLGGVNYYRKSSGSRVLCFAVANGHLFLATREDLLTGALQLMQGGQGPAIAAESWYGQAVPSSAAAGDLRWRADFARLRRSAYFRSYWLQAHPPEWGEFSGAGAVLTFDGSGLTEERVFVRAEPRPAPADAGVAAVMRLAPDDAGVSQAWFQPAPAHVVALATSVLLGRGEAVTPERNEEANSASGADFTRRLDEPPATVAGLPDPAGPLRPLLDANRAQAALVVRASRGGTLPGFDHLLVVEGSTDWDAAAVRQALSQMATLAWQASAWTSRGAWQELDGAMPVSFATAGRTLILASSPRWMNASLSRLKAAPAGPRAHYAARYRHQAEWPTFERTVRLIDFPFAPTGDAPGREPVFFSENVASLGRVFSRWQTVVVVSRDEGNLVRETASYRKP
jgi:hypothetical protein